MKFKIPQVTIRGLMVALIWFGLSLTCWVSDFNPFSGTTNEGMWFEIGRYVLGVVTLCTASGTLFGRPKTGALFGIGISLLLFFTGIAYVAWIYGTGRG